MIEIYDVTTMPGQGECLIEGKLKNAPPHAKVAIVVARPGPYDGEGRSIVAGTGDGTFGATIPGLDPETTYGFVVVAETEDGSSSTASPMAEFTTPAAE